MKIADEYENNSDAAELNKQLTSSIEKEEYLIPMIDLHTFDPISKNSIVWLKCTDKQGKEYFVALDKKVIENISIGIMTAKKKVELHSL